MAEDFHHFKLCEACPHLPNDYWPYGQTVDPTIFHNDCSAGCIHYYRLASHDDEELGRDWGVCINPKSHRCGLLTFEHQGCKFFEINREDGS
jgi:hypothetical protein